MRQNLVRYACLTVVRSHRSTHLAPYQSFAPRSSLQPRCATLYSTSIPVDKEGQRWRPLIPLIVGRDDGSRSPYPEDDPVDGKPKILCTASLADLQPLASQSIDVLGDSGQYKQGRQAINFSKSGVDEALHTVDPVENPIDPPQNREQWLRNTPWRIDAGVQSLGTTSPSFQHEHRWVSRTAMTILGDELLQSLDQGSSDFSDGDTAALSLRVSDLSPPNRDPTHRYVVGVLDSSGLDETALEKSQASLGCGWADIPDYVEIRTDESPTDLLQRSYLALHMVHEVPFGETSVQTPAEDKNDGSLGPKLPAESTIDHWTSQQINLDDSARDFDDEISRIIDQIDEKNHDWIEWRPKFQQLYLMHNRRYTIDLRQKAVLLSHPEAESWACIWDLFNDDSIAECTSAPQWRMDQQTSRRWGNAMLWLMWHEPHRVGTVLSNTLNIYKLPKPVVRDIMLFIASYEQEPSATDHTNEKQLDPLAVSAPGQIDQGQETRTALLTAQQSRPELAAFNVLQATEQTRKEQMDRDALSALDGPQQRPPAGARSSAVVDFKAEKLALKDAIATDSTRRARRPLSALNLKLLLRIMQENDGKLGRQRQKVYRAIIGVASHEQLQNLRNLEDVYFYPHTDAQMASRLGKYGNYQHALQHLFNAVDLGLGTYTYVVHKVLNTILRNSLLQKNGFHANAWIIAAAIRKGLAMNVYMHNTLLINAVDSNDMATALRIFRLMQEENIRPDRYTYTIILGAARRMKSIELFQEVRDLASESLQLDSWYATAMLQTAFKLLVEDASLSRREKWQELLTLYASHYDLAPLRELGLIKAAEFKVTEDTREKLFEITPHTIAAMYTAYLTFLRPGPSEILQHWARLQELQRTRGPYHIVFEEAANSHQVAVGFLQAIHPYRDLIWISKRFLRQFENQVHRPPLKDTQQRLDRAQFKADKFADVDFPTPEFLTIDVMVIVLRHFIEHWDIPSSQKLWRLMVQSGMDLSIHAWNVRLGLAVLRRDYQSIVILVRQMAEAGVVGNDQTAKTLSRIPDIERLRSMLSQHLAPSSPSSDEASSSDSSEEDSLEKIRSDFELMIDEAAAAEYAEAEDDEMLAAEQYGY